MLLKNVTKKEMFKILCESKSLREVILIFNLSPNGSGGYRNIKNKILNLGLEIPKYNYYGDKSINNKNIKRKPNDEIFCKNSTYSRQSLKKKIINQKLIEYKCNECHIENNWNNKELVLHLDHINGINNDNRLENLRFLCPNCHSQTDTYGGKSNKIKYYCQCGNEKLSKYSEKCSKCSKIEQRKIKNRPNIELLINEVNEMGYSAVGRKYGVSDNTIRKWIKKYVSLV